MSDKQKGDTWQWFNGLKDTALIYVNGNWEASLRLYKYGYFKANPGDQLDVYEMLRHGLNAKPVPAEIPFTSGKVEDLAERYEPPGQ